MPDASVILRGTFAGVTDFTTYVNGQSQPIDYPRTVDTYRANGAITKGDWVGFVAATSTVELSVEQLDVSDAFAAMVCVGVALDAATAAGQLIRVCTRGPALCNIGDSGTVALGDGAQKHATTDGASSVLGSGSFAAGTIVGSILGIYLGPEVGTSNLAPVYVGKL